MEILDFDDIETIYALGLDGVITGEREPTEEEQMLLCAIGSGAPNFNGEESGPMTQVLAILTSILGGK